MKIAERIMSLISKSGLKAADIAATTGIDKATFTRLKNKDYRPSIETVVSLAQYFGVSTDWILTGESAIQKKASIVETPINKIEPSLSIDEETLLDNYRDMTTDGRRIAQKQIKNLREEHKKPKGILSNSDQGTEDEIYPHNNSSVG